MAKPDLKTIAKIERKIKIDQAGILILLGLSILSPILAWYGCWQQDERAGTWFQRSGSLTVLFAAWAEYLVFIIRGHVDPISDNGETWQDLANQGVLKTKYRRRVSIFSFISITLLVVGTIIWGYGDLFK